MYTQNEQVPQVTLTRGPSPRGLGNQYPGLWIILGMIPRIVDSIPAATSQWLSGLIVFGISSGI